MKRTTIAAFAAIAVVVLAGVAFIAVAALGAADLPAESVFVGADDVVLEVLDQSAYGAIAVPRVVSPVDGWVVLRAERDGKPAEIIGAAPVRKGENENLAVVVDVSADLPAAAYAMLVADRASIGAFEYTSGSPEDKVTLGEASGGMGMGGPAAEATGPVMTESMDWPLVADGEVVMARFTITPFDAVYRLPDANIMSTFLDAEGTSALVYGIDAPADSWVVVIRVAKTEGDKNEVIGAGQVPAGRTEELSVPISEVTDGSEISALLVADLGTPGVLEVDATTPGRSVDAPYLVRSWFVWKRVAPTY